MFCSVCCIVFNYSWQLILDKKQKSRIKRTHLVIAYTTKKLFIKSKMFLFTLSERWRNYQLLLGASVPLTSALGAYPWPSASISSAIGPQNIARTNLWIKHITYSRFYLFNIKTFDLFKIFKKLRRKAKLWCPK